MHNGIPRLHEVAIKKEGDLRLVPEPRKRPGASRHAPPASLISPST